MKKKYFNDTESLWSTERTIKLNSKSTFELPKISKLTIFQKKQKSLEQNWSNSWPHNKYLFSKLPYLHSRNKKINAFRRKKARMLTHQEKIYNAVFKMLYILEEDPIKYKWLKIIKKIKNEKKGRMEELFDNIAKNFSKIKEKDDIYWLDSKYSPLVKL